MGYVIKGRYDFAINGVSARTVGLIVDQLDPPPMAQQRYTVTPVSMDADLVQSDDVYDDISWTITSRVIKNPQDFDNTAIYAFLHDAQMLTVSTIAGKYFRVRGVPAIVPAAAQHGNEITYAIAFRLAPFKYHAQNAEITPTNGTVTNPGTRYSRPVYKITHSGACTLTVNGDALQIDATAASPIYIDSERMIAYDEAGNNQTIHTTGQYPFLVPGVNSVSTTGTAVEITGNWRDY